MLEPSLLAGGPDPERSATLEAGLRGVLTEDVSYGQDQVRHSLGTQLVSATVPANPSVAAGGRPGVDLDGPVL